MTRIMGDSTTLTDIPASVDIVGTYVNGTYAVAPADLEHHFPHSHYGHVFIDVLGTRPDAQARDWETGDKSGSLEQWVILHNKHSGSKDAVVYCNGSTIPEVRYLTGSQILNQDYFLWIATLDGTMQEGFGIIACQRDGQNQTGGHWDRSLVFDNSFWKPTGKPVLVPPPISPPGPKKPNCHQFQKAIHVIADNIWGPKTDEHAEVIYAAGYSSFPHGIRYAQLCVGAEEDGIWGPVSKDFLRKTVINAQVALDSMGFNTHGVDGAWGPNTQTAYLAARKVCHI